MKTYLKPQTSNCGTKKYGLLLIAASFLAPLHASVVLVDFGATDDARSGYNEVTSLASLASPVSLITTSDQNSGLTLSYTGSLSPQFSNVSGINSPRLRDGDGAATWSTLSGGENVNNVTQQGLGFDTSGGQVGVFTLSGLEVGQGYSLMLLSGVGSTGGSSYLTFVGVDEDYSYLGYDISAGKTGTYTSETDTLHFGGYAGSGSTQTLHLTFTAASTDLEVRIGGAPYQQAVQGLLIKPIPEPSTSLLALMGFLGCLGIRRRNR